MGMVLTVLIATVIALFFWRRRKDYKDKTTITLYLSPEGKEVSSPPLKLKLDSTSVQELHEDPARQNPPTVIPAELGSSPLSESYQAGSVVIPSELSIIPPTPVLSSASSSKALATAIPQRAVPTSVSSAT